MTNLLSAVVDIVQAVVVPLLDEVPQPDEVRPGWVSTVLMVTLIVVTVFLWFSMRKQLGKVKFDEGPEDSKNDPSHRPDHTEETSNGEGTDPRQP